MRQRLSFITVREAAESLRVSPATLRRLIAGGRIRAVRVGRSVRIDPRDLEAFLSRGGVH